MSNTNHHEEAPMELQSAAVSHRLAELRRLAGVLRLERRVARRGGAVRTAGSARRRSRAAALRIALGRRLVALGDALLDGAGVGAPVAGR